MQVGTLVTGFLSQTELGAQSVLLRYAMFTTGFVFALAAAPITLMGRAAGAAERSPLLNSAGTLSHSLVTASSGKAHDIHI